MKLQELVLRRGNIGLKQISKNVIWHPMCVSRIKELY